jgi:hypothetical protein
MEPRHVIIKDQQRYGFFDSRFLLEMNERLRRALSRRNWRILYMVRLLSPMRTAIIVLADCRKQRSLFLLTHSK